MKSIAGLFRRSIFVKVFAISALASIALVFVVGSQLYERIKEGIFEEKTASAISEGRSAIQFIEYQFAIASFDRQTIFAELAQELVDSGSGSAAESGRETILLNSSGIQVDGIPPRLTSNFLRDTSVPIELRQETREREGEIVWSRGDLQYMNGQVLPGVFVGRVIEIPGRGKYEIYLAYDFAAQQSNVDLIGRSMWGTGLLLIALILITASVVLRLVIKPVQVAANVAESLTAGDLKRRIEVKGEDEIARLGIAFNDMANKLASQITRLENLSRVQQRFVSDVSHELRTPLTTIRMASDVIHAERSQFDPTISRSAELLVSQIEKFERLLEDLLEVSRFDAEAATLSISKVDMAGLIQRCVDDMEIALTEKNTLINLDLPEIPVLLDGDPRRVGRIIRNLLNNAIDHCEGLPIDVTLREDENSVAVSVRDYGVGIAPSAWSRVFDRFWRADPSRSRVRGGTGLGLSIAKEDAQLHGGEIRVWGELGKGAHFVLTLPKVPGEALRTFPINEIPTITTV